MQIDFNVYWSLIFWTLYSSSGTVLETCFLCIIPYCSVRTGDVLKVLVIFAYHLRIPFSWCSSQKVCFSCIPLEKLKIEHIFWDFHIWFMRIFLSILSLSYGNLKLYLYSQILCITKFLLKHVVCPKALCLCALHVWTHIMSLRLQHPEILFFF